MHWQTHTVFNQPIRLPGKEGLWQIHLLDGKISAIDAQSGVMPITENSLDAEQGLVIPPFVEPHIHLDTTQRDSRTTFVVQCFNFQLDPDF